VHALHGSPETEQAIHGKDGHVVIFKRPLGEGEVPERPPADPEIFKRPPGTPPATG
jgi:hypothetical protein